MNEIMIALVLVTILLIALGAASFMRLNREEKIECLINWAKRAVYDAEDLLGAGTGQLKLATVYNLAIKQFPWLVGFMTYEEFDQDIVRPALDWLNGQIANNENIKMLLGIK